MTLQDNKPVVVPMNTEPFSIRLMCCDCGLVHNVRILSQSPLLSAYTENDVVVIFKRNNRSTGQRRRYMKCKADVDNLVF